MKINDLRGHMPGWAWHVLPLVMMLSVVSCGDDDEDTNTDPRVGTVMVNVSTTGVETDADGYTVILNERRKEVGPNGTVSFGELAPGNYFARVEGIRVTCDQIQEYEQLVVVKEDQTSYAHFEFHCTSKPLAFSYGLSGVFRMNLDGSGRNLVHYGGEPVWSPDGQELALWVGEDKDDYFEGASGVYVISDDGTESRLIAENARGATWSPDGEFVATILDDQLVIVKRDGSEITRITSLEGYLSDPDWGSDSRIIVGYQPLNAEGGIFSIMPDGSGLTQLTTGEDSQPSWSSDGTRIAFVRRDLDNASIYILDVASGSLVQRTTPGNYEYAPRWSPDDEKLAFVSRFIADCGPYGGSCTVNQVSIGPPYHPAQTKIGDWIDNSYAMRPDWRPVD